MKFVLYAFLVYLAYLFIFRFVIPIHLASRKIKKGFREMQERMNEQYRQQQQGQANTPEANKTPPKPTKGDYIEFEEIKPK
jgi:hypothetical protein